MTICFLYVSCGSILPPPQLPYPPPLVQRATGILRPGGVQKEAISEEGEGLLTEIFFQGI